MEKRETSKERKKFGKEKIKKRKKSQKKVYFFIKKIKK
jgi:hypothetical protein